MRQFTFGIGRHVKHKLGTQTMVVIEYDKVIGRIHFGSRANSHSDPVEYTGKILCGWVDEKNHPQRALFNESELEEVD